MPAPVSTGALLDAPPRLAIPAKSASPTIGGETFQDHLDRTKTAAKPDARADDASTPVKAHRATKGGKADKGKAKGKKQGKGDDGGAEAVGEVKGGAAAEHPAKVEGAEAADGDEAEAEKKDGTGDAIAKEAKEAGDAAAVAGPAVPAQQAFAQAKVKPTNAGAHGSGGHAVEVKAVGVGQREITGKQSAGVEQKHVETSGKGARTTKADVRTTDSLGDDLVEAGDGSAASPSKTPGAAAKDAKAGEAKGAAVKAAEADAPPDSASSFQAVGATLPSATPDGASVASAVANVLQPAGAGKPVAAAAVQAPPPPPEVRFAEANHANIVSDVRTQLLPGGGSMKIRLDPPELGALQVSVEMRDGTLNATFQTSNDDATRLLSHSLSQLKTALESQGVNVDRLQVQQSPREQQATNQEQSQQQRQPDQQSQQEAQREQQRREMLERMWRRVSGAPEPVDLVA